jgi:hypothetical protein
VALAIETRDSLLTEILGYDPAATTSDEYGAAAAELGAAEQALAEFQREAATAGLKPALVVATLAGYQERVDKARAAVGELGAQSVQEQAELDEVRAGVAALQAHYDEDFRATFGDADQTREYLDLAEGPRIMAQAEEIWDGLDLNGRRKVVRDRLEVVLLKPEQRADRLTPKAVRVQPKAGEWDPYWKPAWIV